VQRKGGPVRSWADVILIVSLGGLPLTIVGNAPRRGLCATAVAVSEALPTAIAVLLPRTRTAIARRRRSCRPALRRRRAATDLRAADTMARIGPENSAKDLVRRSISPGIRG
jgi:hypothetical protein